MISRLILLAVLATAAFCFDFPLRKELESEVQDHVGDLKIFNDCASLQINANESFTMCFYDSTGWVPKKKVGYNCAGVTYHFGNKHDSWHGFDMPCFVQGVRGTLAEIISHEGIRDYINTIPDIPNLQVGLPLSGYHRTSTRSPTLKRRTLGVVVEGQLEVSYGSFRRSNLIQILLFKYNSDEDYSKQAVGVDLCRKRVEFYSLKQLDNEPIKDFYLRLKNKAIEYKFGSNLKDILRDKFVSGLRGGTILDRVYEKEQHTVTLDSIVQVALNKKAALRQSSSTFYFNNLTPEKESYTKLDLANAYNQLELTDSTKKSLSWSTHRSIYQPNRLPYDYYLPDIDNVNTQTVLSESSSEVPVNNEVNVEVTHDIEKVVNVSSPQNDVACNENIQASVSNSVTSFPSIKHILRRQIKPPDWLDP
ncbi:hypothetical protein ILUMI_06965 [Ignelater luminosus]|uniref:Uncharacterized protein n=1 Tax=Ignelater luminosus TaxID=2038154 RepID=A0A8K0D4D6_IGNLU|nr:hypothetical protein ILUMI_06965 [Ignelater luminosus]